MGGYMLTGWQTKNGREYYLTTNGDMVTGWFQYNRVWYYLDPQVGKSVRRMASAGQRLVLHESGRQHGSWLDPL